MKVHGFKVKLTAFLPAEPFNIEDLKAAWEKLGALRTWLDTNGFNDVDMAATAGSVIRKRPDEPKAAQAVLSTEPPAEVPPEPTRPLGNRTTLQFREVDGEKMPPLPAALKR